MTGFGKTGKTFVMDYKVNARHHDVFIQRTGGTINEYTYHFYSGYFRCFYDEDINKVLFQWSYLQATHGLRGRFG
jgi:hypothetical protein